MKFDQGFSYTVINKNDRLKLSDGINRGEDPYYHHAMNYYCDIFGAEHPGSSRPELGLPQGAPTFMLTHHHGDDVGSGMDPHQTGAKQMSK